jgi:hypothetical protein
MTQKFNVVDYNDKHANKEFRYQGTYLHGILEKEIGYDIFCFDRPSYFTFGATRVIIEKTGRMATFFLWKGWGGNQYRGYMIYNNDPDFESIRLAFENEDMDI